MYSGVEEISRAAQPRTPDRHPGADRLEATDEAAPEWIWSAIAQPLHQCDLFVVPVHEGPRCSGSRSDRRAMKIEIASIAWPVWFRVVFPIDTRSGIADRDGERAVLGQVEVLARGRRNDHPATPAAGPISLRIRVDRRAERGRRLGLAVADREDARADEFLFSAMKSGGVRSTGRERAPRIPATP